MTGYSRLFSEDSNKSPPTNNIQYSKNLTPHNLESQKASSHLAGCQNAIHIDPTQIPLMLSSNNLMIDTHMLYLFRPITIITIKQRERYNKNKENYNFHQEPQFHHRQMCFDDICKHVDDNHHLSKQFKITNDQNPIFTPKSAIFPSPLHSPFLQRPSLLFLAKKS